MSSGEFAAATRLSRKALRIYQELGLLEPAAVDRRTGYRSYAPDQVRTARLIGRLRLLDLPLSEIGVLLELEPAAAAKTLEGLWRAAEETHAERRRLVRHVQDILTGRDEHMYEIQTRDVPEQKVLAVQRNVTADRLRGFIDEAYPRLYGHLEAGGARAAGPSMMIYHGMVTEDSDGPVEICVPFTGTLEPVADLGVRLEPARTEAYTTITRAQVAYPDILRAYDAVSDWLQEQGHKGVLSPREVYVGDMASAGPDDLVCDVAFPYATR
jgi:DNA-binding transcriptional MerR regulator